MWELPRDLEVCSKLAERIVAVFGAATFEIIEANPEKLKGVSGIGEFRAGKIAAGWAEHKAIRDIMLFLRSNGVGTSRAVRIFKTYGKDKGGSVERNTN